MNIELVSTRSDEIGLASRSARRLIPRNIARSMTKWVGFTNAETRGVSSRCGA